MANIITINERSYLFDLGFGANTPLHPLPLPPPSSSSPLTTANRKLTFRPLLSTSHPSTPPSLIYFHRASPTSPWTDAYALSREEFHGPDFAVMNAKTSSDSIFTRTLVCVRLFFADEPWFAARAARDGHAAVIADRSRERGELAGQLVLVNNTLKYRILLTPAPALAALSGGDDVEAAGPEWSADVPLATFASEDERVEALRTYYDVRLSEEESRGILGAATALGGDAAEDMREVDALAG